MNGKAIRKSFLDFFKRQNHPILTSSSLIPHGDPSLLFTSAGMVPLKPYFLGLKRDMSRAASCQKSFRTTDIDRVGMTIRHLTFFEMLGNFSFGDYFKAESINWGWTYLTKEVGLDPHRLYVTVYGGGVAPKDEEAAQIWAKVIPTELRNEHIKFLGDDTNFWTMGPTGPCGPCSEIYYDFGPEMQNHENCSGVGCDCDRYIEIWNHVFTQFDRQDDGSLKPLPRKNIDTGMGLERLTTILQGKHSPFETDLFSPVSDKAAELLKITDRTTPDASLALRIISDHSRACSFLISEGITPSNEGRGYVLRRIIRRSVRYGKLLGCTKPFMHEMIAPVEEIFDGVYPEIKATAKTIRETVNAEEERFLETLESGEKHLQTLLERSGKVIPGEDAFKLYETYGFPMELTREIALKNGKTVDEEAFDTAKTKAQETAKARWKGSGAKEHFSFQKAEEKFPATVFSGYNTLTGETELLGLVDDDGNIVSQLSGEGYAILHTTPFYAECGGQVGDTGALYDAEGKLIADVTDTQRPVSKVIFHRINAKRTLKAGEKITASVSKATRGAAAANHTSVHVINALLRKMLGDTVRQAGSFVSPERFRFDYTSNTAPTRQQLDEIEQQANDAVREAMPVCKEEKPLSQAAELGAVTLLGEKYADPARFVLIGKHGFRKPMDRFSLELCGGTHVDNTSEIITIKILKDSALSAGVRRIEGVAGTSAVDYLRHTARVAENVAQRLVAGVDEVEGRIEQMAQKEKQLRQEMNNLKQKMISGAGAGDANRLPLPQGLKLVWTKADDADTGLLRNLSDKLRDANDAGVIMAASVREGRMSFVISLSNTAKDKGLDACAIARAVGAKLSGKGGGRKDFAQGGGNPPQDWNAFAGETAEIIKGFLK